MDRLFAGDSLSKRERVERTLDLQAVDRVALHEQLSYNPGVISLYTGRSITGFDYSYDDICTVIRQTLDACFPPVAPLGTDRVTDRDGFVIQQDNWHSMIVQRPFQDVAGARDYLLRKTEEIRRHGRCGDYGYPPGIHPTSTCNLAVFDPERERDNFRRFMLGLQSRIGDTVIIDFSIQAGFCECWSRLGLDTFSYLYCDDPQVVSTYLDAYLEAELMRLEVIADRTLSPVVLIAEDFASKRGPIFSPALLRQELFPRVRRLAEAWHRHGLKVLYHSDGYWKHVVPDLVECRVDGFYCLEPSLGMDIVALRKAWPRHVWAGGLDGVDLMERGTPDQVRREVRRIIEDTDALQSGGVFIDTSSEINPPIQPDNFRAMIETVGEIWNREFRRG
jgi:uroporphyrinogen decarboxylase